LTAHAAEEDTLRVSTDRDTGGERIVSPEVEVRWARIKTLFTVALEKDPADRAGFLAEACGGDAALRGEIESLLAASDGVGTFLDAGANSPGGLPPLGPGTRLGPYEIVSVLGAGGMGEVYRGRDTRLGREIAIKILAVARPGEDVLRRFELEARAASALDHPNILAVHDVGTHEGRPFIVSELLRGRTLREELEGHRLPLRTALDLAVQMARGLSAAHQQGIVHRDLKPENLFVTEDGRLKILDFGIAKLLPSGPSTSTVAAPRTQAGMVLGTIGYMSPEQIRGGEIDARSDIFSFGVILYEMVFGARAFGRRCRPLSRQAWSESSVPVWRRTAHVVRKRPRIWSGTSPKQRRSARKRAQAPGGGVDGDAASSPDRCAYSGS
jgi:serine/threonine protein kinase